MASTPTKAIILLAFFILNVSVSGSVFAKPEHGKKFKDWTVVCEKLPTLKTEVCNIFQNVTNEQGRVVLQIAIGYPPGQKQPQALITLPLGVLLAPGIEVTPGEVAPFRVPYSVCVKNGCVAMTPLDDKVIAGMKSGSKGKVEFAAAQNKVIAIPISLSGFSAAFNSLQK